MLNAIIIDDEKKGISALKQLVERFIPEVKIIAECLEAVESIPIIEKLKPEIVFLDIDMPEMNGFEMLDQLTWKRFHLIFTTAHQEYGLKALKSNAVDYLLKPINHKELQLSIEKIKTKLADNNVTIRFNYNELLTAIHEGAKSRILISSITGIETVSLHEALYLESQSNCTKLVLSGGSELLTRKTLKDFESQLCTTGSDFMRVHNSFIVSLSKVSRYLKATEEIILHENFKIPLSKSKRDSFFKWMNI